MADLWRFFCRFLLFTDPTVVLRLMSAWPSPISDLSTRLQAANIPIPKNKQFISENAKIEFFFKFEFPEFLGGVLTRRARPKRVRAR